MIICGLKLTHDAAIALIDNGKLIFSYEVEKINNQNRHAEFVLTEDEIYRIFEQHNYELSDVDSFVIDGWRPGYVHPNVDLSGTALQLHGYDPLTGKKPALDVIRVESTDGFPGYATYQHVSGHIAGAYCSSPFAKESQAAYIVVWDGPIGAQLYYFDPASGSFQDLGWIHFVYGSSYAEFATRFPPFNAFDVSDMAIPGKVMAYIALGSVQLHILEYSTATYEQMASDLPPHIALEDCRQFSKNLQQKIYEEGCRLGISGDDMMYTYHCFLEKLLLSGIKRIVDRQPSFYSRNICFTGGCALNIKWNSAIRKSGLFTDVWVPPFPNDSGSAIGTACCEMIKQTRQYELKWSVFSGPELQNTQVSDASWEQISCSLSALAKLMHELKAAVVFLHGRAELGPRALGHRSILAPATSPVTKGLLNDIKQREHYRPVAPICLEEFAKDIFEPGIPDPYMLFDHCIKPEWRDKIPGVLHLDNTARLQTIHAEINPEIHLLLKEYYQLSKIPVLCNTSANFKGKGFFPDVASAIEWGCCDFIWSEHILWYRTGALPGDFIFS